MTEGVEAPHDPHPRQPFDNGVPAALGQRRGGHGSIAAGARVGGLEYHLAAQGLTVLARDVWPGAKRNADEHHVGPRDDLLGRAGLRSRHAPGLCRSLAGSRSENISWCPAFHQISPNVPPTLPEPITPIFIGWLVRGIGLGIGTCTNGRAGMGAVCAIAGAGKPRTLVAASAAMN